MNSFKNWSIAPKTFVILKSLVFQLLTFSLISNVPADNAFKNLMVQAYTQ